MARRRKHEEHQNHEGWAIPYGDLVTLLLAFFVVMYSISQVNEGKYRILSDSLQAAFRGAPTTLAPVQVGDRVAAGVPAPLVHLPDDPVAALRQLALQAEAAMQPLIAQGVVDVVRGDGRLSIGIRSDILFASGSATLAPALEPVILQLGGILKDFPVDINVEGHTDNVPITSSQFRSNWELSVARAASVVHLLIAGGVAPVRLAAVGYGEHRPLLPNATPDGRNANRRVMLEVEVDAAEAHAAQAAATEVDASGS
jgi:chemotaxis protein MotB